MHRNCPTSPAKSIDPNDPGKEPESTGQPSPQSLFITSTVNPKLLDLKNKGGKVAPFAPVAPNKNNLGPTDDVLTAQAAELANTIGVLKAQIARDITTGDGKTREAARLLQDAATAAALLKTDKTDALSVYGRFDSHATTSVVSDKTLPSTGLPVGKVFSTGLASQNLTEAAKIDARAGCLAQLYQVAKLMAVESERSVFLRDSALACTRPSSD